MDGQQIGVKNMNGDAEGGVTQILHRTCPLREMSQLLGLKFLDGQKAEMRTREVTPGQICGGAETCKNDLFMSRLGIQTTVLTFLLSVFF